MGTLHRPLIAMRHTLCVVATIVLCSSPATCDQISTPPIPSTELVLDCETECVGYATEKCFHKTSQNEANITVTETVCVCKETFVGERCHQHTWLGRQVPIEERNKRLVLVYGIIGALVIFGIVHYIKWNKKKEVKLEANEPTPGENDTSNYTPAEKV